MEELDIPIFKKTYELYKTFHSYRNVVPKADRYTLWQRAENLILDILENILQASQRAKNEKISYLEQAGVQLNMLRIFLRLTKDTKALDMKKTVQLQMIVDEIGRMLGGWMKSTRTSSTMPPPRGVFEKVRRNCRAADNHRLSLRLSSQLLLTFTRPLLTLSSARLSSGSVLLPIPI